MKKENLIRQLGALFVTFAKVGIMTFGGGYAMLPMLEREVVNRKKWATNEEIMNYFAVGQCTPGVFATLGVVFPSVVIITIIAAFIQNFADLPVVTHAFAGVRAVVAVLVVDAVIKFFKAGCKDWFGVVVAVLAFIIAGILGISSVYVVIGALVVGLIAGLTFRRNIKE